MGRKPKIWSGRCWIPPEWRPQIDGRLFSRWPGARVAVAGAVSRRHATDILASYLPLLAAGGDDEETTGGDSPDGGGHSDPYGYQIPAPAEHDQPNGLPDVSSARRMMIRLRSAPLSDGARALMHGGVIHPYQEGVYVWRWHRAGQHVYIVGPDRWQLAAVGQFRSTPSSTHNGGVRPALEAVRAPTTYAVPPRW